MGVVLPFSSTRYGQCCTAFEWQGGPEWDCGLWQQESFAAAASGQAISEQNATALNSSRTIAHAPAVLMTP